MHPLRIPGNEIAERMLARLAEGGLTSTRYLAGFVAAHDAPGMSFQKAKQRAALRAGATYRIAVLPDGITQADAAEEIRAVADDPSCGGIVIQLPLPPYLDTQALLDLVPPEKDPDVLGTRAYAAFLAQGDVPPPAARAVSAVLEEVRADIRTMTVAVVGMGRLVGAPVADWAADKCHALYRLDKGFDESLLGSADLVVLGTGAYTLDPRLLKPSAGVIDFGYRQTESGPTGDLDTSDPEALSHLSFYTPTPRGTGPVLIASLIENFALLTRDN